MNRLLIYGCRGIYIYSQTKIKNLSCVLHKAAAGNETDHRSILRLASPSPLGENER
jgi:hypothetical protein